MEQYISKSLLVAEIERRIKSLHQVNSPREQAVLYECKDILSFIDSLEVKEVDLDNHTIMEEIRKCGCNPSEFDVATHFFELGLKAQKGE